MLVSWYFEPGQPQRMTSRPKTMFNRSPIYSARKSSNQNLSKNHKISSEQTHKKQKVHKHQTQNFRRISSFGIAPVKKKHIRLGLTNVSAKCIIKMLAYLPPSTFSTSSKCCRPKGSVSPDSTLLGTGCSSQGVPQLS